MKSRMIIYLAGVLAIIILSGSSFQYSNAKATSPIIASLEFSVDEDRKEICPYLQQRAETNCPYLSGSIEESSNSCPYLSGKLNCPYNNKEVNKGNCPYLNSNSEKQIKNTSS